MAGVGEVDLKVIHMQFHTSFGTVYGYSLEDTG